MRKRGCIERSQKMKLNDTEPNRKCRQRLVDRQNRRPTIKAMNKTRTVNEFSEQKRKNF